MASVFKYKDRWRAQVRVKGKNKSKLFDTRREATKWANEMEQAFERSARFGEAYQRPFADALRRYAKEVSHTKKTGHKEQHYLLTMAGDLDKAPDELAMVSLSELSARHFASWRDRRLKEVSAGSVLREWSMLSAVCKKCVTDWEWLQSNPMQNVQRPKVPKPRERRVMGDELERIVFCSGYDVERPPVTIVNRVGAAVLFAVETAMRAGEIVNLSWDDVDIDQRTLFIPVSKNGSARTVPLSKKAIAILEHLQQVKFPQNRCFGLTSRQLDSNYRKIRTMAAVDGLRFHDLRREALTRLAKKVDVMTLAKISGHRDLRILQNVYYAPNMADFADKLD